MTLVPLRASRSLSICGLEYRVVFTTPDEVAELAENDGLCRRSTNTIYIRKGMPASRTRDTLIHEVMHAFLEASGLGHYLEQHLKDPDTYDKFEETLIRLMVPSLLRLVEDNGQTLLDVPTSAVRPTTERPKRKKGRR